MGSVTTGPLLSCRSPEMPGKPATRTEFVPPPCKLAAADVLTALP
jgi:hypothetical protein